MKYYQCLMCGILFPNMTMIESHSEKCAKSETTCFAGKTEREMIKTITISDCYIHIVKQVDSDDLRKLYEDKEIKLNEDEKTSEISSIGNTCRAQLKLKIKTGTNKRLKVNEDEKEKAREIRRTCPLCNKKFSCHSSRNHHMQIHIKPPIENSSEGDERPRPFRCEEDDCGKTYVRKDHLNRHIRERHPNSSASGTEGRLLCKNDNCRKSYLKKGCLIKHIAECHTNSNIKFLECEFCHKTFETEYGWKRHQDTHVKGRKRSFICHICSKGYFTKEVLQSHLKITHAGQPSFKCNQCEKAFRAKKALNKHKRIVHDRNYPYKCKACGKEYGRKSRWIAHCQSCEKMIKLEGESDKDKTENVKAVKIKQEVKKEECDDEKFNFTYIKTEEELNHLMIVTDVKMEFPI